MWKLHQLPKLLLLLDASCLSCYRCVCLVMFQVWRSRGGVGSGLPLALRRPTRGAGRGSSLSTARRPPGRPPGRPKKNGGVNTSAPPPMVHRSSSSLDEHPRRRGRPRRRLREEEGCEEGGANANSDGVNDEGPPSVRVLKRKRQRALRGAAEGSGPAAAAAVAAGEETALAMSEEGEAGGVALCRPRRGAAEVAGNEGTSRRSTQLSSATPVAEAGQAASTERSGRDDDGVNGWHKPSPRLPGSGTGHSKRTWSATKLGSRRGRADRGSAEPDGKRHACREIDCPRRAHFGSPGWVPAHCEEHRRDWEVLLKVRVAFLKKSSLGR